MARRGQDGDLCRRPCDCSAFALTRQILEQHLDDFVLVISDDEIRAAQWELIGTYQLTSGRIRRYR